ncbi:CGNR zinc finger domain-containing protein [Nocardia sp. NPDC004168]
MRDRAHCGLLFVDAPHPGRHWCSMELCGDLSGIRRYRGQE